MLAALTVHAAGGFEDVREVNDPDEYLKIPYAYMSTFDTINGENGGNNSPDLKPLHPESSLDPSALDYWRRQSTDDIVESLRPYADEALRVYPDGTIANGNTRFYVLRERGFDVNSLPREPYNPGPLPGAPEL